MQPNKPIHALDGRYYTDPEIYDREARQIFRKSWQFACHQSVLAKPGDYYSFTIAGEPLFLVKGQDDMIRGFYNVCQHRGHVLLQEKGNARLLVCPYHAWSYDLTGKLRAAPNANAVEGFEKNKICLTEVKVENFLGFLFVNLDDNAASMDDNFPNARQEMAEFIPDWPNFTPLQWVEIEETCNWKISVENYSECYHCSLNHITFSKGVIKPETYDIQPQGHCLRHTTQCQSLDKMTYPIDLSVPHAGDYSSWFLWPCFSFQIYPGNLLNTYHWCAHAVDKVTVWRGWYSIPGLDDAVIAKLAQQDRDTTVAEDIRLVENVQRGLASAGYRPGPLVIDSKGGVNSEHSIAALHQWYRQAMDNHN